MRIKKCSKCTIYLVKKAAIGTLRHCREPASHHEMSVSDQSQEEATGGQLRDEVDKELKHTLEVPANVYVQLALWCTNAR